MLNSSTPLSNHILTKKYSPLKNPIIIIKICYRPLIQYQWIFHKLLVPQTSTCIKINTYLKTKVINIMGIICSSSSIRCLTLCLIMVLRSNIWTHTIIINHNITSINTVNSNTVSVPKVFQSDIMSKKKVWTILFFRQKKI